MFLDYELTADMTMTGHLHKCKKCGCLESRHETYNVFARKPRLCWCFNCPGFERAGAALREEE